MQSPALTTLAYNLLFVGMISLVVSCSGHPALGALRIWPLRKLGQISYGLYLYHVPLLLIGDDLAGGLGLENHGTLARALALLATVGVAAVSWRYIEAPLLSLKNQFAYRPTQDGAFDVEIDQPDAATVSATAISSPGPFPNYHLTACHGPFDSGGGQPDQGPAWPGIQAQRLDQRRVGPT